MKFQISTDYAMRVILYLSQHGNQISTAGEMAEKLCVTYSYIMKVTSNLRAAGYVESIQGPFGGFRLAKDPSDITLYDIIEAIEGKIQINRCLEDDPYCNRFTVAEQLHCPVHLVFETVQNELISLLKNKRISEFSGVEAITDVPVRQTGSCKNRRQNA